jgi:hypothetical protein
VADIDDDQEGRAAFGGRQRAGIAFGLRAGAQQRVVEAGAGPCGRGCRRGSGRSHPQFLVLPDAGAAPVDIDAPGAAAAVAVAEGDRPLEHVVLRGAGVRRVDAEQPAQLDDEALRGGQLRGGHAVPAGDEGCRGRVDFGHGADDRRAAD